jgi:hypothetical protein
MKYLVYITDQIHHLMNEYKKLISAYNNDRRKYPTTRSVGERRFSEI